MLEVLKNKLINKLPIYSKILQRRAELEMAEAALRKAEAALRTVEAKLATRSNELQQKEEEMQHRAAAMEQRQSELEIYRLRYNSQIGIFTRAACGSVDPAPWKHPFLEGTAIRRFRDYSERVWEFAKGYAQAHPEPLKIGFVVNMAQNMYKWARLASNYGAEVKLFPHPLDTTALNTPEWEEFDGEYADALDGQGFLSATPPIQLEVACERVPMDGGELLQDFKGFWLGRRKSLLSQLAASPELRYEALLAYNGFYPYYRWARELSKFDVLYSASSPISAYFSGRPYCAFSVGADLQFDCGRGDDFGMVMSLSFNAARFILVSNPHTLGHCRRLGLTAAVYLPYPMDDRRYCPGPGKARAEWETRYGRGLFVLMTSRLDSDIKGQDECFFRVVAEKVRAHPDLHFIFLGWGKSADEFRSKVQAAGLQSQLIVLNPVGKKRLIDYYRSCDWVLDSFVFGYYGATALEAASIGKPVILKLRKNHYDPLYHGDIMPALHAETPAEMGEALGALCSNEGLRLQAGSEMRGWLVRNHGEEKTVPLMLALLRVAADRATLPEGLANPLDDQESEEERAYHESCLKRSQ